jgi:hypothetical protein
VLLVPPLGRHLHGGAGAVVAADPDPAGVAPGVAERRGAAGADPVAAAVVALALLGEALLELGPQQLDVDRVKHPPPLGIDGEGRHRV